MDFLSPDQVGAPSSCCVEGVALTELIPEASAMLPVATGLLDAFFSILIRKKDQKQFTFPQDRQDMHLQFCPRARIARKATDAHSVWGGDEKVLELNSDGGYTTW